MVTETFGYSSIYDFQNKKDYLNQCKKFLHIHGFVNFFKKLTVLYRHMKYETILYIYI